MSQIVEFHTDCVLSLNYLLFVYKFYFKILIKTSFSQHHLCTAVVDRILFLLEHKLLHRNRRVSISRP